MRLHLRSELILLKKIKAFIFISISTLSFLHCGSNKNTVSSDSNAIIETSNSTVTLTTNCYGKCQNKLNSLGGNYANVSSLILSFTVNWGSEGSWSPLTSTNTSAAHYLNGSQLSNVTFKFKKTDGTFFSPVLKADSSNYMSQIAIQRFYNNQANLYIQFGITDGSIISGNFTIPDTLASQNGVNRFSNSSFQTSNLSNYLNFGSGGTWTTFLLNNSLSASTSTLVSPCTASTTTINLAANQTMTINIKAPNSSSSNNAPYFDVIQLPYTSVSQGAKILATVYAWGNMVLVPSTLLQLSTSNTTGIATLPMWGKYLFPESFSPQMTLVLKSLDASSTIKLNSCSVTTPNIQAITYPG